LIQEILTYLSERPQLKEAKSFGHLYESISLLAREKRNQKAWAPHRAECKNFIKDHLKKATHFDSVLVLGSGPLHEIPIEELAQSFKKVTLVDIVHLKTTKKSIEHLKNVEFIEHDITECESTLRTTKKLVPKIPERFLGENWGLVLSVNVMSQLPLHFETYIEKNLNNRFSKSDIDQFLKSLTENHFKYLSALKSPTLLITDVSTNFLTAKEEVVETYHNYLHLNLPSPHHKWTWRVAPIPEFRKDIEIQMKVSGFILNSFK
jgi:hypothetical protein